MNKFKILIILLLIVMLGCKNKKEDQRNPVSRYNLNYNDVFDSSIEKVVVNTDDISIISFPKVSETTLKRKLSVSEIADSISLIKLETTNSCLIGDVDKIVCFEGGILILDIRKSKSLFLFDYNGKFIRRIGEFGRGPGEYIKPYDFCVNEAESEVTIFDVQQNKVLIYNLQNGAFKDETILGFWPLNFAENNGSYVFNLVYKTNYDPNIKNHMLLWTNRNGKIYSKGLPYVEFESEFLSHWVQQTNFYSYDGTLNIRPAYTDTIFQIRGNELVARYVIENDSRIPWHEYINVPLNEFRSKFVDPNSSHEYVVPYGDVFETKKYLILFEMYKNIGIVYLYNKFDNSKTIFTSIEDDRFGNLARFFFPRAMHKNSLITVVGSDLFSSDANYLDSLDFSKIPKDIKEKIVSTDLYDNPSLLFVHLKDQEE